MPRKATKKTAKELREEKNKRAEQAAARLAAREQELNDELDEEEEEEEQEVISFNPSPNEYIEYDKKDIFVDGPAKARAKNTTCRFRVNKDGPWIGTFDASSCNRESLQKKFGGGNYKITAVDSGNQFLDSQSIDIANPPGWGEEPERVPVEQGEKAPGTLEMIELMRESQREAKSEVNSQASSQTNALATMMTAMTQSQQAMMTALMTMQQQSTQQTQNMMLEMNKQSQVAAQAQQQLMLTLLTQKKSGGDDLGIKDLLAAEARGEDRANKMFKLIDEKVEDLVEEREALTADKEHPESVIQTVLKGFTPILAQIAANNPGLQGHQNVPQEFLEQPTAQRRVPAPGERHPDDPAYRAEQAARVRAAKLAADRARPVSAEVVTGPTGSGGSQGLPVTTVSKPSGKGVNIMAPQKSARDPKDETRDKVFELIGSDIGLGLVSQTEPKLVAEQCVKTLEKHGFPRQTVIELFSLEILYRYAKLNGVPDIAKPWLKGLHAAFQVETPIVKNGKRDSAQPGATT